MFHARYIACMERTPPSRPSSADRRRTAEALGRWLRDRMITRGYDMGPRGGGQRRLAEQTGLAASAISRLLAGTTLNPDPQSLRLIAEALALPSGQVPIHARILTEHELRAL